MKNITVTVDDEVYRRARVWAAEQGTSVSAIMKETLQRLARDEDHEDRRRRLHALYSEIDTRLAGYDGKGLEPGWRNRMHDERFDNSLLGRAMAEQRR